MKLRNRVAIVTGGSSGIGEAIAERFREEGAAVAVLDLRAGGRAPAGGLRVACDVSREADVAAAVADVARRLGRIDILVNNAGLKSPLIPIEDIDVEGWDEMIGVHVRGTFLCCKHVVPHMKAAGRGAIINVSSLAGVRGRPNRHAYIAAKHGMVGLTRSVAMEGRRFNIRANAIAPGPVASKADFGGDSWSLWQEKLDAHLAAGRSEIDFMIRPQAIAAAALFLASDDAVNITGSVVPIDSGVLAGSFDP